MVDTYIRTVAEARAHIGTRVYWDDVSTRYVFLRSGVIREAKGRDVVIDGEGSNEPTPMKSFKNLRNFENGGAWLKAARS